MAFVTVIRALATILVINSHCDEVLPVAAMATGGSLGDMLFFFVSGFCLYHIKGTYFQWIKRRLSRIYPSIFIVTTISLVINGASGDYSFLNLVRLFVFPTRYAFITALLIFYMIYYLVVAMDKKHNMGLIGILIILAVVYLGCYFTVLDTTRWRIESKPFVFLFWGLSMFIGAVLQKNYTKIELLVGRIPRVVLLLMPIIGLILFYVLKCFVGQNNWQFLIHLVEICILFAFVFFLVSVEGKLSVFKRERTLWKPVEFISSITLENYLLMDIVIRYVKNMRFPISYILVFFVTFASAYLLHLISNQLMGHIGMLGRHHGRRK